MGFFFGQVIDADGKGLLDAPVCRIDGTDADVKAVIQLIIKNLVGAQLHNIRVGPFEQEPAVIASIAGRVRIDKLICKCIAFVWIAGGQSSNRRAHQLVLGQGILRKLQRGWRGAKAGKVLPGCRGGVQGHAQKCRGEAIPGFCGSNGIGAGRQTFKRIPAIFTRQRGTARPVGDGYPFDREAAIAVNDARQAEVSRRANKILALQVQIVKRHDQAGRDKCHVRVGRRQGMLAGLQPGERVTAIRAGGHAGTGSIRDRHPGERLVACVAHKAGDLVGRGERGAKVYAAGIEQGRVYLLFVRGKAVAIFLRRYGIAAGRQVGNAVVSFSIGQ